MLDNFELKGNEYLLLSYLTTKQRKGTDRVDVWQLEWQVTKETSISRTTYYRCMESLKKKGYLDKDRWGNYYTITDKVQEVA